MYLQLATLAVRMIVKVGAGNVEAGRYASAHVIWTNPIRT